MPEGSEMDLESILWRGDCTRSVGSNMLDQCGCSGYSVKLQESLDVSPES